MVGVSRGTAVVMVLGCCWELGMGLLMSVSRETLFLNLIQLLGNAVQRLKALTCMPTF